MAFRSPFTHACAYAYFTKVLCLFYKWNYWDEISTTIQPITTLSPQ